MTSLLTKDRATPTAADYRRILVDARKAQLKATAENVRRLERTYNLAAQSLADQLANLPGYMLTDRGALEQAYLRVLLGSIDRTLGTLRSDYARLLDVSLLDSAQAAAERERQVEDLMGSSAAKDPRLLADLSRSVTLSDGSALGVQFGRLAQGAVEATTTRYYRDGLKLSDRLYQLDRAGRRMIEDTIVQAVAEGTSAKDLATRLQATFVEAGSAGPRYQAMRIARTEINAAHREAHIRGTMTETGALKDHIQGIRWQLSLSSHKVSDVCDVWAAHEEGLGPGIYLPANVPSEHPHGLCVTVSVLKAFPDVGLPAKKPNVADVPDAQIDYYAAQGDVPAQAARAARQAAAAVEQAA